MNFKHKLGYMFIGCLFTILGYILASLGGMTTHAQKDEQVIDEIVCRKLRVVNAAGKDVARIEADEEGNGIIGALNAAGKEVAGMVATTNGGGIAVSNRAGEGVAAIAQAKNGGEISIFNTAGELVVHIMVNEDGNGTIETYKDGLITH